MLTWSVVWAAIKFKDSSILGIVLMTSILDAAIFALIIVKLLT